jgi:hypothetical protein
MANNITSARRFVGFIFEPQPVKRGNAWHVYAQYPGGERGHILGFDSEAAAVAWLKEAIASQSTPSDNENTE